MKKIVCVALVCAAGIAAFAASYTENEYQIRALEYTRQAKEAFDEADYDRAIELSRLAEEQTDLSRAYIQKMLTKADAENGIRRARERIAAVEKINAEANFPMAYSAAKTEFDNALAFYDEENYEGASESALRVIDILAEIRQVVPLPKYYVVRPWSQSRDCFWNISGRPYIYNNPRLWENLYQANKNLMPDPQNPNLIVPGMRLTIPSVSGEFRDGTYDPKQKYEAFKK
jgi:nucleoid-associated protein YgaU